MCGVHGALALFHRWCYVVGWCARLVRCVCGLHGSLAHVHRWCCVVGWWRTFCGVFRVSMALWGSFTTGAMLLGRVRTLCVVCAVFMAFWRSFTAGAMLLNGGGPCALCGRCPWLLGVRSPLVWCRWVRCAPCALCVRGRWLLGARSPLVLCRWIVCAPCVCVCGVHGSLALVHAGAVLLNGGACFALCVRFPWLRGARSFTAGAILLGSLCTLCVVCAVCMAPWRSFTAGAVLLTGGAPCA